ncbi:Brp/Blh family beta-carotene 15,15'-dioxygenase [Williamsia sp. CHRR-6]|uniref:Brp/Blh family beta-carotene 15,15'-dioxygenase n=1 Tax=Williamsia sp. CHRR-6 TaxID=2835871 RepID=UPI001BDB5B1B|nr:Brp/Blh family beta-carotene 15,15'-dioxygenase [Williamsia sp. CHRR-6]MBT0567711.1 Brp/Blh family beta-carotene 15,15'-dioxygenase [Williamsia sp. CHRR-6]
MRQTAISVSRACAVAAVVVGGGSALIGGAAGSVVAVVLVVGGLAAGLPHGAIDHQMAAHLFGLRPSVAALAYGCCAGVAWAVMTLIGWPAVVAALVLSLLHFAAGEAQMARAAFGPGVTRWETALVGVAGCGALLLPMARYPSSFAEVAHAISPGLDTFLSQPWVRWACALLWAAAALATVVIAARRHHRGLIVDVALIAALGALAPPLVAFAVWFGGWHSVRHLSRLLLEHPSLRTRVQAGDTRSALRALLRWAAAPTAAAVVFMLIVAVLIDRAADPTAALGTALVVLLALTVPHMGVVAALDHQARRGQGGSSATLSSRQLVRVTRARDRAPSARFGGIAKSKRTVA